MRKRTAALIELDREKRVKFQQVLRDFIRTECEVEVPEDAHIIPDVEHNKSTIMQYGMEGSNPFIMDPENLRRILEAATFTFTWYQWEGELDEPITTPPREGLRGGSSGWASLSNDDKDSVLKEIMSAAFADDDDKVH